MGCIQTPLDDQADYAAVEVELLLHRMIQAGLDPFAVLAGAHGLIVAVMAQVVGGERAADQIIKAAERVRPLPAQPAVAALMQAQPMGRA